MSAALDRSCVLSPDHEGGSSPIGSAADNHTGSNLNMDLIKTWLRKCLEKHHYCRMEAAPQALPLLPTRVVDVEAPGQPCLVETTGIRADYLTLSYCWGEGSKLLCKKGSGSYEQFKKELPLDNSMPKTFKDALQVTRMLGYRYLWIDAICIIQDDPEDLRNEMAVMGDIYRQSAVTIFAANGPNTDSGLFSKRDARTSKACNVLITLKRDSKLLHGDISIKMGKDTSYDFLNSRGWVLQEEVLSGRLIAFGPSMVDWRCMEIHTCEGGTTLNISNSIDISHNDKEMLFEMPNDLMRSIVRRPDLFDKSLPSSDGFRHTHFDTWYEMVRAYSRRELSVHSDKLLAIAGLARLMQKNYDLTYAAGLWKEDLQVGLCWWVNTGTHSSEVGSTDEESLEYLAPTWSWASVPGRSISFTAARRECLPERGIQVLGLEVSHLPGALAAFGCITFAKLTVRTRMRRAMLIPHSANLGFNVPGGTISDDFHWGVYAFDPLAKSFVGHVYLDSMRIYEDVSRQHQDPQMGETCSLAVEGTAGQASRTHQSFSSGFGVWCVPCLVETWDEVHREMSALILTESNTARHEYRRIGFMKVKNLDIFPDDNFYNTFVVDENLRQDFEIIHIV